MNVGRVLGRVAARAAAAGLAVGYVGLAVAADEPIRVAPAGPVAEVCPTCTAGEAGAPCAREGCSTCGRAGHRAGCNPKKPVVGQLRPGACFGYFQTQWHRWEDVCPLPYQGVGIIDTPRAVPPAAPGASGPGAVPKSDGPVPKMNPMPTVPAPMPMPKGATPIQPTVPVPPPAVPENKFGK